MCALILILSDMLAFLKLCLCRMYDIQCAENPVAAFFQLYKIALVNAHE